MVDDALTPGEEPGGPSPRKVLPIIALAPAVGALLRWVNGDPALDGPLAALLAAGAAGLLGVPTLAWLVTRRRTGPWWIMALGFAGGAVTLLLILLCGVVGLTMRYGAESMSFVVRTGAPLPWFGQITWGRFAGAMAWTALVGATSAVLHASCFVWPRRLTSLAAACLMLVFGMAAARLLP